MQLKDLRLEKDLTRGELAEIIGVTKEDVIAWEDGKEIPPNYLIKLSNFFECAPSHIQNSKPATNQTSQPATTQNVTPPTPPSSKQGEPEQDSTGRSCLVTVLIFVFFAIVLLLAFTQCNNQLNDKNKSDPSLVERKATVQDIFITDEYSFPVSISLHIRPSVDIDDLVLTIGYYDDDDRLIKTQNKVVGDVTKGVTSTVTIKLTDFSLSEIGNIDYCKYYVSSGTVSIFS